ncbi:putative integral membrane protein [Babesia bovis T2Bo]|uniref:putative integral membrane protein n=1 Tax=Babesia bovis T2Bo TaxID=484906 RepID=UPI001C359280|nr:putative integral membrane protein [Babesia bovis T2Bo]KAG6440025.1 putative integral membrane protein [Babesia bovis T2Bo]
MIRLLAIPALLCSGFFVGGGVYAYLSKRSLVSLIMSSVFSGCFAGSTYIMIAQPERSIGFCLAATTSLLALAFGAYRMFFVEPTSTAKKHVATTIYSVGLGSSCFYIAVLMAKKLFETQATIHLKGL